MTMISVLFGFIFFSAVGTAFLLILRINPQKRDELEVTLCGKGNDKE
jgi:hypothetical protein